MISSMIQEMLTELSSVFDRNVGFIDTDSAWFCNNVTIPSDVIAEAKSHFMADVSGSLVLSGYTFMAIDHGILVCVEGTDEVAQKSCDIIRISLGSSHQLYSEKFDRTNFLKNVLSDNILPNELLVRAQELQLSFDHPGVVMIIRGYSVNGYSPLEVLHPLFSEQDNDFLVPIDENNIALIKSLPDDFGQKTTEAIAQQMITTINADALTNVTVGIGSRVDNLRGLSKSYKDANMALEVGKVFDGEKNIIHYENLGIGRLIYQLPTTLCELFLSEIFKKESLDSLDRETLHTIDQFFENNLNISEASRQLYVHRNTLVYRLDKVQKLTGLDLRIFDDAIVFKIALMVKKYLDSNPMKL